MTFSTSETEDLALTLPITQAARRTAEQFASHQPTSQKAEQVYLNTLAVWVVNDYLQMLGMQTDVAASGSWNRYVRLCSDAADLEVTGAGRLECRPLKPLEQTYRVPPEVLLDRVGYAIVQIDAQHQEATFLGFTPTATLDEAPVDQLQTPEALVAHLNQLIQRQSERPAVSLNQWLQAVDTGLQAVDAGWQTVEALFNPLGSMAFSFRSRGAGALTTPQGFPESIVRRAKLLDLGIQLAGEPVALIMGLSTATEDVNIFLQVHPFGRRDRLPPQLQLMVLDEFGTVVMAAEARSADNYIQLLFSGEPGERFRVKVALGDASITEDFVI